MREKIRKFFVSTFFPKIIIFSLFFLNIFSLWAFQVPFTSTAREALLIDLSTGAVLFEKNADKKMAPSSMTKILTAYLILESLKNKDFTLADKFVISDNASRQPGSRMVLNPNQRVCIEDLLKGIVVLSGNDACVAIAEGVVGSEASFAEIMNEKAKELGATDTHFVNASGLPSDQHWSTCWDLARMAERTIKDFPEEYKKYYSIQEFTFNKQRQKNKNGLLRGEIVDGIKTGKTDKAKCGMVASSQKDGRRLLLVVNGIENESKRAQEVERLLNWGFTFFYPYQFFKPSQPVMEIPVWNHSPVSAVSNTPIGLSLPKRLRHQMKVIVKFPSPLIPPIKKGQQIATLIISVPKHQDFEFPLVADQEVPVYSFWKRLKKIFSS